MSIWLKTVKAIDFKENPCKLRAAEFSLCSSVFGAVTGAVLENKARGCCTFSLYTVQLLPQFFFVG